MTEMWILFRSIVSVARSLGGPWIGRIGPAAPHQCRWAGVVWAVRCRDGAMGCCGVRLFFVYLSFLVNSHIVHFRARRPACSPTGALLHRWFPSNLSTTTQGAIVKVRETTSELWTLLLHQCGTVKLRSPRYANCSGVCWEEGMGVWGVLVSQEVGSMKS